MNETETLTNARRLIRKADKELTEIAKRKRIEEASERKAARQKAIDEANAPKIAELIKKNASLRGLLCTLMANMPDSTYTKVGERMGGISYNRVKQIVATQIKTMRAIDSDIREG